jgi:hypothetical protein
MFEHRKQPLISPAEWRRRVAHSSLIAGGVIVVALSIGVLGYHFLGELGWLDSLVNASMILGGMGPVDHIDTRAGKFFASFYALFSGVIFIGTFGVLGYHFLGELPWLDALVNASMILGGMGPVDHIDARAGKFFVSFYALFSGVIFIGTFGVLIAPWAHRMLHRFHAVEDNDEEETPDSGANRRKERGGPGSKAKG